MDELVPFCSARTPPLSRCLLLQVSAPSVAGPALADLEGGNQTAGLGAPIMASLPFDLSLGQAM